MHLYYGQPADPWVSVTDPSYLHLSQTQYMKPILVINPVTGEQSYTKHPERLLERHVARREHQHMVIINAREATFWNGSSGSDKLHIPGEVRS